MGELNKKKTTSQDVGVAENSLQKKSPGRGLSSAQGVKQITLSERLAGMTEFATSTQKVCTFVRLRSFLDLNEFDKLMQAMDDPALVGTQLAQALRDSGFDISDGTVNRCRLRRRKGDCKCL
jgi:hypothetical protein